MGAGRVSPQWRAVRRRRDQGPPLPQGVALHTGGRVIPLELVYFGTDSEGIHQWRAVLTPAMAEDGGRITVERLPARTAVAVLVVMPETSDPDDWRVEVEP